ncbi:DUF5060 domain-containing protein [Mariniphaga sp.]|uniref:DUF5060 domain-containing protein n=1 Tax=Mariniphaga sp. TaxID=1954475 RepID=UPI0035625F71
MNKHSAKRFQLFQILSVFLILFFILNYSAFGNDNFQTKVPEITVSKVNSTTIKKYEKFEIRLEMQNVTYENPFDPEEIDLYAIFQSPSGKEIRINGFYDNYEDANHWKIRFSPNETGAYNYQVFVENNGKKGNSDSRTFEVVNSEHSGWIKQSEVNPRYFAYDDGSTYFAVGVYSPWRNNQERFDRYKEHNANFFAIWDIGYGGFVNGTGIIEEELGRYNQLKCGRIDSMLTIFEQNDIKLMYAIWPHDLFSETVWAAEWDKNPFRHLIDVADVYKDSLVWEYQKKKYRYLIARYAHSRSWGIWELINEMNGTDGWAQGRHQEAFDWVAKAQKYFTKNDPYGHPMTASFSGGFDQYREQLHEIIDVPNLHLYPRQGWELKYPEDSLRSAMYNYAWAARRFYDNFEKPSIFGESGAEWEYFKRNDDRYQEVYHNAIWASLTNGLAGIPVWWDYTFLTQQDWEQLNHLAGFVADIDFAHLPFEPADATADGADIYVMDAGKDCFGWMRSYSKDNAEGTEISLSKKGKGNFEVSWFDAWNGKWIKTEKVKVKNGKLILTAPKTETAQNDIAFKIRKD